MKKLLISLAVIALAASHSHAGLLQTFGVGARNSAQAEAVAAHANDPFAVYYNPAGLTLIQRPVVSVGITVFDAVAEIENFKIESTKTGPNNYNTFGPSEFESNGDLIYNPNIGFAMPIGDRWSFGIAAYAPYGLHLEWDKDYTEIPGSLFAYKSKYVREAVSPTLAYKLSDKLSVGFGVSLGKSICESGRTLPAKVDLSSGTPVIIPGGGQADLNFDMEDEFNYSFNAGIMYRPVDALSLGLTYRGRTETDFEGDLFLGSTKIGTAEMEFDHPESVQAGARVFVTDRFSVEVDATWTRWSINEVQLETLKSKTFADILETMSGKRPPNDEYPSRYDRDWEDTVQYKIGTEWKLAKSFALRAGYTYDPTPVPDETFDFGWPDTDRNVFALGFGWDINENWTIDGVVQHVRSTSPRKVKGDSDNLNRVYGGIGNAAIKSGYIAKAKANNIPITDAIKDNAQNYADTRITKESARVSMENEGILWGYGINITYKF